MHTCMQMREDDRVAFRIGFNSITFHFSNWIEFMGWDRKQYKRTVYTILRVYYSHICICWVSEWVLLLLLLFAVFYQKQLVYICISTVGNHRVEIHELMTNKMGSGKKWAKKENENNRHTHTHATFTFFVHAVALLGKSDSLFYKVR